MVQDVEELAAELEADFFRERYGLQNGKIDVGDAGADQRVAADVSVSSRGRQRERVGIEPLIGRALDDGTAERRIRGRTNRIAAVAIVGGIESQLRCKWEARLGRENSTHAPAARELVLPSMQSMNREFIAAVDDGEVADIGRREAPIQFWM